MHKSFDGTGSASVNDPKSNPQADSQSSAIPGQPAPQKRRRSRYAVADVLLRRLALGGFVLIALIAGIIAAVNGR